jgi:hypothetical protein
MGIFSVSLLIFLIESFATSGAVERKVTAMYKRMFPHCILHFKLAVANFAFIPQIGVFDLDVALEPFFRGVFDFTKFAFVVFNPGMQSHVTLQFEIGDESPEILKGFNDKLKEFRF